MDLELLKRFYRVAEEGSLIKASKKVHVVPSALTKSISDFEDQQKMILFTRTRKGMRLTPQGERLHVFAKQLLGQVDNFERAFQEKEDEIEGEIRILTTPYVGVHWLIPNMTDFLKKHPNITVKYIFNNEEIRNLGGADVGICPFISQQENLIQEFLFSLTIYLFTSLEYIEEFGSPQKPEDLDHHRLITYREDYYASYGNWILNVGRRSGMQPRKPYIQADTLEGMLQCTLQGIGITEAPNLTYILESGLKKIMPQLTGPQVPYHFIYEGNRRRSKKINFLLKYLIQKEK